MSDFLKELVLMLFAVFIVLTSIVGMGFAFISMMDGFQFKAVCTAYDEKTGECSEYTVKYGNYTGKLHRVEKQRR